MNALHGECWQTDGDILCTFGPGRAVLYPLASLCDDGLTGSYLKVLFQRLGIADNIKAKHHSVRGAEAVAGGEVELGITQISEILYQKGTELAGPLPSEIQNYTNFSAAISAGAKQPGAAQELIKYFASADAVRVMKANGLEPAR